MTFDSTSGSSGEATPRIFAGVANLASDNVFVSEDGGSTCKHLGRSIRLSAILTGFPPGSAVAGQNNTFMPHKGVLSPAEKALYISYSDGAGPYDGTTVRRMILVREFRGAEGTLNRETSTGTTSPLVLGRISLRFQAVTSTSALGEHCRLHL